MKLNKPKNSNYAAVVVEIQTTIPLEGCDNVHAAIIMGNHVIVSKDTKAGDVGLYFPLECQLSEKYLSSNNLYRKAELNSDKEKKGYFEENGRIRCVKFRGHKSEGLFMPLGSLKFTGINYLLFEQEIGAEFDEINDIEICRKYVIKHQQNSMSRNAPKLKRKSKESKLVDNQFRFHEDTNMLYKNLHKIQPDSLISITYKLHGTSGISSYILCKKPLKWYEKVLKYVGVNIVDTHYDYIYSSRKVIKNEELNPNAQHYYSEDIWGIADKELRPFLQKGLTLYYEIVGYLPNGGMIQKDYDYGYNQPNPITTPSSHFLPYKEGEHYGTYLYRITYTNVDGKVFEYSAKQVQDFCKKNGLKAVPELYYGKVKDFYAFRITEHWESDFLEAIKIAYNEKDCYICNSKVPEEGCVIRIEQPDFEAYKQKSNRFYERETKLLDKGEVNLEDNQ